MKFISEKLWMDWTTHPLFFTRWQTCDPLYQNLRASVPVPLIPAAPPHYLRTWPHNKSIFHVHLHFPLALRSLILYNSRMIVNSIKIKFMSTYTDNSLMYSNSQDNNANQFIPLHKQRIHGHANTMLQNTAYIISMMTHSVLRVHGLCSEKQVRLYCRMCVWHTLNVTPSFYLTMIGLIMHYTSVNYTHL